MQGYWPALIGEVSSVSTLKGTGFDILTCALTVANMAAAAMMVDRKDMMFVVEMISCNGKIGMLKICRECDDLARLVV